MLIEPKQLPKYGFFKGFRGTTRGAEAILRHPRLLLFLLGALVINGCIIGLLLWWGWGQTDSLQLWLIKQSQRQDSGVFLKSWIVLAGWLKVVFVGLKWLVLVLVLYFVAPTVYIILLNLNPASALLAAQMFAYLFAQEAGLKLPEAPFMEGLMRTIKAELRKLVVMLFLMIVALLFNVIPIIGSIVAVGLMFLIGVQFSGWSYITPYYEALKYDYAEQRTAMRHQRAMIWGLGVISAIPIFNILALFIGPVGGALLAAEMHKEVGGNVPATEAEGA